MKTAETASSTFTATRDTNDRWENVALAAILLLALLLRVWDLQQNGWGAEYYSAAVRSMTTSWHNFFYAAFDPEGFISVDKPPISLWIQVASVELFGFHPLSVLLPQAAEGVASVWLLFHLVRRRFTAPAALLAASLFAISPIAVAVNRTNNTDSCLVLVLLLAAWVLLKAAETGNRRHLLLSMMLIGVAFNVKMLAAYIVLPVFFLIYFLGAPQGRGRRIADLGFAALVVAVCSMPWVLMVELTPPQDRPFVGSSSDNSMLELVVGHNAFGRFVSRIKRPAMSGGRAEPDAAGGAQAADSSDTAVESRVPRVTSRLFVRAPTGPLRIFRGQLAAQTLWLLPFALAALALGLTRYGLRRPISSDQLNLLFWLAWIGIYAIIYGYAGGIMHYYYLSTLAPAVAALAGIGLSGLWREVRQRAASASLLAGAILLTAVWELYIEAGAFEWSRDALGKWPDDTLGWLHAALIVGSIAAAAAIVALQRWNAARPAAPAYAAGAFALGLASLLVVPMAWTLSSVLLPGYGVLPSADLYRVVSKRDSDLRALNNFGQTYDASRLVRFLNANRSGERYLLATSTAQLAAPIIIETGEAAMARGGFHGLDPAVTPQSLAALVDAKQVRFAMLGDVATVSRLLGADAAGKPVADWIRAHGRPVPLPAGRGPVRRNVELFDLRAEAGPLRAAPE